MTNKIVHVIPKNTDPSGGIKVHFQLSELERELGYDSCVAVPNEFAIPTWFKHNTIVKSWGTIWNQLEQDNDVLVVGWEDIDELRRFKAQYLVSYVQGEVFFNKGADYTGIQFWVSSEWNQNKIGHPGYRVTPFIDRLVFYPDKIIEKFQLGKINMLVQERKAGRDRWEAVNFYLPSEVRKLLSVKFLEDVSEDEFAKQIRLADIFFAHSYPEGLSLPPLEAFASNTLVVGYTGGGGTDYMQNGINSMICADGDAQNLATVLSRVLSKFDRKFMMDIIYRASKTVDSYNKENTKNQLKLAIDKTLGLI
jgi:hypothetical protein